MEANPRWLGKQTAVSQTRILVMTPTRRCTGSPIELAPGELIVRLGKETMIGGPAAQDDRKDARILGSDQGNYLTL